MYVFSPARKKRLRANIGHFPDECLNQTSREARRRKPLPIHHLPATEPPTEKPCCYQQQSTATAPRMPHRAHEKGQQV